MLRRRPASFVAGRRAKRTIFALPNLVRSVERSATNISFQSVGSITANCTAMVTRPHGGPALASIRCPLRLNSGGDRDQAMADWRAGCVVIILDSSRPPLATGDVLAIVR